MRKYFDEQLALLDEELIKMGALIEAAISGAVKALTEKDATLAQGAIAYEKEIDRKEKDIEQLCLKLLLRQQPVAKDLRLISAALKMITDMERIGDMAADIAEIALSNPNLQFTDGLLHIPQMATATIGMVNDCIDAFVHKDETLAHSVLRADDVVDDLFTAVRGDLAAHIRANVGSEAEAMDLLMAAKYFERIGDHATNIAEWVLFSVTGIHPSDDEV